MSFYCSICCEVRPDEGPHCGFCGTGRERCETAEPPKRALRCMKCGGSTFKVDSHLRAECKSCSFAVANLGGAVISEPPKVAVTASGMTPWSKGRRESYGCRSRCDGYGKRVS